MLAAEAPSVVQIEDSRVAKIARLNCAGAGCDERDGCRRYEARVASGRNVSASGYEWKTYTWASFDVERRIKGTCSSFVRIARAA